MELPLDSIYADIEPRLRVKLLPYADDGALAELIRRHPQLNSGVWSMDIPSPRPPSPPRSYDSRGRCLDEHSRQIWRRIVDQLGTADSGRSDPYPAEERADTHQGRHRDGLRLRQGTRLRTPRTS